MKRLAYILVLFLLTIGIPFAILNVSLFKNISNVNTLAYMVGFVLITTSATIGIIQYNIEIAQERQQREYSKALKEGFSHLHDTLLEINEISVYTVDRDAVYDRLKNFIQEAKYRADLMYFGDQPPSSYLKSTNKDEYVETLDKVIMSKTKNIRRIILYTHLNKEWIKLLADRHRGNERFSLSIIMNDQQLPLVSAQIIDNNIAILMNLDRSVTPSKPRDIVIESKKVCSVIESYYQDMHKLAIPILVNGKISQGNYQRYL